MQRLESLEALKLRTSENPLTGCWEWALYVRPNGYAVVNHEGARWYIHRLAVVLDGREIPEGWDVDHLCKVRHCCNPAHLEPVTRRENLDRSPGFSSTNKAKTCCPKGHPLFGDNLLKRRSRQCKTCSRDINARWLAKPGIREMLAAKEKARRVRIKAAKQDQTIHTNL